MSDDSESTSITVGSSGSSALMDLLTADDIEPGSKLSYQTAKAIYAYHPLGKKLAEAPITEAQSQPRTITVADSPDEVVEEFEAEWKRINANTLIHNVRSLSRVYGIASIAMICEGKATDVSIDMDELWKLPIYFNVLDPLNTSGSLVLNQNPLAPDFNKATFISVNGQRFHPSRCHIVMNEQPIYIEYTTSAFGYVGRSVYQRALDPLKTFILTMIADGVIATKNSLLVAKQKQPGSILDNVMEKFSGIKRSILKWARAGQVLSIDIEESIETLNMQNVKEAGEFARGNCLKNIATSADMPALMVENETLAQGLAEGSQDAKIIARYLGNVRSDMDPSYGWFDNIVQYRAWTPDFFKRMQENYPKRYIGKDYKEVFSEWRRSFKAVWPNLLEEPESERVKTAEVKFRAIVSLLAALLPVLDSTNKVLLIQWACDNINENSEMFEHAITLDDTELESFFQEEFERQLEQQQNAVENSFGDGSGQKQKPAKPPQAREKKLASLAS